MRKLLSSIILVLVTLSVHGQRYLNLDLETPASDPNTPAALGWNIDTIPSHTGGVDNPQSQSQTIGNTSPVGGCVGTSMFMSLTTNLTSTQTNGLFWNYIAGNDSYTYFIDDSCIYITNLSASNAVEMDFAQYNFTENREHMFGWQCVSGGYWQVDNLSGSWQNTTVPCSLVVGTWYHIIRTGHFILGDTSCSGYSCNHYDKLIINGTVHNINMIINSDTLAEDYPSAFIVQRQIDIKATTGIPQTVSYSINAVNFYAYSPLTVPVYSATIF